MDYAKLILSIQMQVADAVTDYMHVDLMEQMTDTQAKSRHFELPGSHENFLLLLYHST